ncbi:MAG: antibiotic biosynthesis monooxygenase [Ectothiorhodospiraceae bacterium]|nr:antibiotic biosynthesis monooxygenase [Ectothiorhodospiraceae bacterium]MCH8506919.1 antibiotic biosynthesis monooxygenase [Ectothiorhodospiraceae bacterium]
MYTVTNRVWVEADYQQEFEERFRRRAGEIDKQPGFVRMEVLRPASEGAPYLVVTTWESKQAFENWVGSEDFRAAHANPMPKEAFSRGSEMERHETVVRAVRD